MAEEILENFERLFEIVEKMTNRLGVQCPIGGDESNRVAPSAEAAVLSDAPRSRSPPPAPLLALSTEPANPSGSVHDNAIYGKEGESAEAVAVVENLSATPSQVADFVVAQTVLHTGVGDDGLHGVVPDIHVPLQPLLGGHRHLRTNFRVREAEDGSEESSRPQSEDSDATWLPETEDSPNSSEYLSHADSSSESTTYSVTEEDVRPREVVKGPSTEEKISTKSKMGKEKESFELWSKPKERQKPGTRANPSADSPQSKAVAERETERKKKNSGGPRGMKSTTVRAVGRDSTQEAQKKLTEKNNFATGGGNMQDDDGAQGIRGTDAHLKKKATMQADFGAPLTVMEEEVDILTPASPQEGPHLRWAITMSSSDDDELPRQREGKQMKESSSSESQFDLDSEASLEADVRKQRKRSRRMPSSSSDSRESLYDKHGNRRGYGRRSGQTYKKKSHKKNSSRSPRENEDNQTYRHGRWNTVHDVTETPAKNAERLGQTKVEGSAKDWMKERGECSKFPRRRASPYSDASRGRGRDNVGQLSSSSYEVKNRRRHRGEIERQSKEKVNVDETKKRKDRRHRQSEREGRRQQRERQGLRGHYLSVDYRGIPYSFGVSAWRAELNKLTAGLDPSVMNIRNQPEEAMATLRRRLKENFEYSAPVDRAYIRALAGRSVTQRRSRILASMRAGASCPAGMNDDVWRRLDRIRQDPSREELSQRMKYANSCRVNKGRTGPKGEEGIRLELENELGREPYPDEVEYEMRRSKGYEGVRKTKRKKTRHELLPEPERSNARSEEEDLENEVDRNIAGTEKRNGVRTEELRVPEVVDMECIERMQRQMEQLQSSLRAARRNVVSTEGEGRGPWSLIPAAVEVSNVTAVATRNGTAAAEEEPDQDKSKVPEKKKSKSKRK